MQQKKMAAAEAADYDRAFTGLDFPAATPAILRHAHDHGGLDTEVLDMLGRLPRQDYETEAELRADIHALYIADGYDNTKLPV